MLCIPIQMDQIYHCNDCNVNFPDKEIAIEHRNGTGHVLNVIIGKD